MPVQKSEIKDLLRGLDNTKVKELEKVFPWIFNENAKQMCSPPLMKF